MSSYGFNFRGTAGFVTDNAGETYVLDTDAYPVTRNGITFGYDANTIANNWIDGVNRNAGIDVRLAGINYTTSAVNDPVFQVDLPATGSYNIRLAFGDASFPQSAGKQVTLKDTASAVLTIGPHAITADKFWDASDVEYTSANWPASNSPASVSFATTTANIVLLHAAVDASTIAHIYFEQATTGGYLLVKN